MSDSKLPDDPAQWPTDPFDLLGVGQHDDLTAVRRAYTRLIRRFKPEHYPDQFRRLRSAYESILNFRQMDASEHFEPVQVVSSPRESGDQRARIDPTERPVNKSQQLWALASQGEFDRALVGLRDHPWERSQIGSAALMEYWITKLKNPHPHSELPCKILLRNLQHFRRLPKVLQLAADELRLHPALAREIDLEMCVDGLLDCDDVLDLLQLRWQAALRCSQFQLIAQDWRFLSLHYFEHQSLRAAIALTAVDFLIWSTARSDQDLVRELTSDLESTIGLKQFKALDMDRLDQLVLLCNELIAFVEERPQWLSMSNWVSRMWNDMDSDFATDATEWLARARNDSSEALEFFDDVRPFDQLSQYFVRQFEFLIVKMNEHASPGWSDSQPWLQSQWQSTEPTMTEVEQIEIFLSGYEDEAYGKFRVKLAHFAIENQINPRKVVCYTESHDTGIAYFFRLLFANEIRRDHGLAAVVKLLWMWQV